VPRRLARAALTLLAIAMLEMPPAWQIAVLVVAVVLAYWIHRLRPVLGRED
jgi:hypothetical protein